MVYVLVADGDMRLMPMDVITAALAGTTPIDLAALGVTSPTRREEPLDELD
jgi:hypothetical protein